MKLIVFLTFISLIFVTHADVLDEQFFIYILENVVVSGISHFNYIAKIRFGATITNAAYDAMVPYLNESIGIYSNIPRRPLNEHTIRNKNIAIGYATKNIISRMLHESCTLKLNKIFSSLNLNPNDDSLDLTTPVGIGNYAAMKVLDVRARDGMNQYGDLNGKLYNRIPYEDYTGYKPKNTAYDLKYPFNWQPLVIKNDDGLIFVQTHSYPQYRFVQPFSYINTSAYFLPEPIIKNTKVYKQQIDEILNESRNINDYKKLAIEHFEDKISSLFLPLVFLSKKYNLSQDGLIMLDFLSHMALFDAGIVVWNEKLKYDSVRPISAIRYLYKNKRFEAWGGHDVGIVQNISGSEWTPYVKTHDSSEYPAAIPCFCAVQFTVLEKYFGNKDFGYIVEKSASSSEATKATLPNIKLGPYKTFDEYVDECALSRFWGGVHFNFSAQIGKKLGKRIGNDVYSFAINFIKKNGFF